MLGRMQRHFLPVTLVATAGTLIFAAACADATRAPTEPEIAGRSPFLTQATETRPAAAGEAVLVGAGDIAACASAGDEATAALLDRIAGTVFTAGDNAYPSGSSADFQNCYAPSWGRHKARTRPTPGNHEYLTAGAAGYFAYFGAAAGTPGQGYYSYDLAGWHVVALNSSVAHDASSPQLLWLRADLAAHPARCILAYWHHARFSSGSAHGNDLTVKPFWNELDQAGAELVISGHDHDYERFAPQTPSGVADPTNGIREFVVGTGGKSLRGFGVIQPNSQVRNASTYGVLKLTLRPGSYRWKFVPVSGGSFTDSGNGVCH
jgi:3',5'-cyclic AMP phosphodiesterase CpdA